MKRSSLATTFLASGENRVDRWRWIVLVLVSSAFFFPSQKNLIWQRFNSSLYFRQRMLAIPIFKLCHPSLNSGK